MASPHSNQSQTKTVYSSVNFIHCLNIIFKIKFHYALVVLLMFWFTFDYKYSVISILYYCIYKYICWLYIWQNINVNPKLLFRKLSNIPSILTKNVTGFKIKIVYQLQQCIIIFLTCSFELHFYIFLFIKK